MKTRLFISLILSIYLSGCSSLIEDVFTEKSHKIATDSIDMSVVVKADLDKNQLLIYATAYIERTLGSTSIRMTDGENLALVINDSEQKSLSLISVPDINERYKYVYGIRLALDKYNDALFRLKFIRSYDYDTEMTFKLPADISFVSSEPSLTAGKLNLTRNYARGSSTKVYWQAGVTPNPEDRFYFKSENESCTIKENNQVLGTYKKLAPNAGGDSKQKPYNINSSDLSGYLSYFSRKKKSYINIYTEPNEGYILLSDFIYFKEQSEKTDFSKRADYLSIHCDGTLFLSSTASLGSDEQANSNYQLKGDMRFHSSSIKAEKIIRIPFFFDYKYTEKNEIVDGRDGETAHLMFIRQ